MSSLPPGVFEVMPPPRPADYVGVRSMADGSHAIETRALTKRYGSARGIEELDLVVEPGEVFAYLGPNGAGKSTTIRTLLDFQRATSGGARIFGLDIERDSVEIRRRVGYLAGDCACSTAMTGEEHIRWFTRARGRHGAALTDSLIERFERSRWIGPSGSSRRATGRRSGSCSPSCTGPSC